MNEPLQKDWPADPVNEELLRLAEELNSAPPLPSESLARVHQQMATELDSVQRRDRRRRVVFGWSIAAAVLLALGGYAYLHNAHVRRDDGVAKTKTPEPDLIEDRIIVALGDVPGTNTDKPLVRLDDNRSLFMD